MKHLEIFTRLKNGEIICIESCNIEKTQFFGFTFNSRIIEEKHCCINEIDESWNFMNYNDKLKILQDHYNPLDHYHNFKESNVRKRHGLLTDAILIQPFLNSHPKKVA